MGKILNRITVLNELLKHTYDHKYDDSGILQYGSKKFQSCGNLIFYGTFGDTELLGNFIIC